MEAEREAYQTYTQGRSHSIALPLLLPLSPSGPLSSAQLSIGPGFCFWNNTVEKLSVQCFEVGDKSRARAARERERESTPATESEPRAELAQRHSHSRGGVAWCVCVCTVCTTQN